jgi:hypothetical protein
VELALDLAVDQELGYAFQLTEDGLRAPPPSVVPAASSRPSLAGVMPPSSPTSPSLHDCTRHAVPVVVRELAYKIVRSEENHPVFSVVSVTSACPHSELPANHLCL